MADGATDVGTREVLDVYVKLLENGKGVNTFVALKEWEGTGDYGSYHVSHG